MDYLRNYLTEVQQAASRRAERDEWIRLRMDEEGFFQPAWREFKPDWPAGLLPLLILSVGINPVVAMLEGIPDIHAFLREAKRLGRDDVAGPLQELMKRHTEFHYLKDFSGMPEMVADTNRHGETNYRLRPADFAKWAQGRGWDLPDEFPGAAERVVVADAAVQPVQRSAAQDAAILAAIKARDLDPRELPPFKRGARDNVKAQIRSELGNSGIWAGKTVFGKAWERLTKSGEIAYKS